MLRCRKANLTTARTIVSLSRNPYEIIVGNGILDRTGELVREILAAGQVRGYHRYEHRSALLPRWWRHLRDAGFRPMVITIPAGEKSKSLETTEKRLRPNDFRRS